MDNILVATDFSTRSDRALRRAVLVAGKVGAALTLVHVVDDDQPNYMIGRQREVALELLNESVRTIIEIDRVQADMAVRTGDAFTAILDTAEEIDAGMIVIGPHRRRLKDIFVGTTAERTIRGSRRPVLVANAMPSGLYRRSLLAIDFDEASRAAVQAAQELGILERTELVALHVFDVPALGMMQRAMDVPEAIEDHVASQKCRVSAEFDSFVAGLGLRRSQQLLRPDQGSPARAILTCAADEDADLIIVGSSGRKGVERLLIRSVAQEVILEAPRDVLVIPFAKGDERT